MLLNVICCCTECMFRSWKVLEMSRLYYYYFMVISQYIASCKYCRRFNLIPVASLILSYLLFMKIPDVIYCKASFNICLYKLLHWTHNYGIVNVGKWKPKTKVTLFPLNCLLFLCMRVLSVLYCRSADLN